ncbi:hypothetical protein [Luteolibacter marinus]|uniref:hypothetical protein n=1 Tax=Luteolibacter marinus TaxID=2776705 RepID=UPI001865B0A5|nr:hypothetical protein [Luteolibacter marinus]
MAAPDIIGLADISGPWPAIVVSGLTGGSAALNGTYLVAGEVLQEKPVWRKAGSAHFIWGDYDEARTWRIDFDGATEGVAASNSTEWPWTSTSWGDYVGAQVPVFTRAMAPPVSVDVDGGAATVQATATTALAGANNDLVFTAVPAGRLGNAVAIFYVDGDDPNAALDVSIYKFGNGQDATWRVEVVMATDGAGVVTSTAAQVKAAIEAHAEASELVTVAHAPGNDGSGTIPDDIEEGWTLTGGLGGLPFPPDSVTL